MPQRTRRKTDSSSDTLSLPFRVRIPAEWEPHISTWLAWPHFHGDWPGKFEPIPWVYAEIIRNLSRRERVDLIVNDAASEKGARKALHLANALNSNVRFHRWPTDRVWTRDSGCTFVCSAGAPARDTARSATVSGYTRRGSPTLTGIKWRFNAWAKYPNYRHDGKIGSLMAQVARAQEFRAHHHGKPVVLEGGSIDTNGAGVLLTTEECLLSKVQYRNPGFKKKDYEKVFASYLGIEKVLWLGRGITGDDTHGHVDDITRFVAKRTILTMVEPNRRDENHAPLQQNLRRLKAATDQHGKSFEIVEVPMPAPVVFEGRRLPASYGNFYIANGIVLVPVFNDPNDRVALNLLAEVFPARKIVPIYSGDLIWGFGAMHCMTQQQPAVRS
jgi:agmatine deiminase